VILLGDIFDRHDSPRPELIAGLNRLSAPLGVWSVQGNHEAWGAGSDTSLPFADGMNAQMLRNLWVEVKPGLILAGVDDLTAAARAGRDTGGMVEQTLAGRPSGGATILLSHTPWQAELAAQRGVSLMLSGHTHGGQIWPFNYLVRRLYPLFAGRYNVGGMAVIVTRGAGTWGPRMRLWRTGEIVRITLRANTPRQQL
jgi:predicted MPP superfamily phosphohydrolase